MKGIRRYPDFANFVQLLLVNEANICIVTLWKIETAQSVIR